MNQQCKPLSDIAPSTLVFTVSTFPVEEYTVPFHILNLRGGGWEGCGGVHITRSRVGLYIKQSADPRAHIPQFQFGDFGCGTVGVRGGSQSILARLLEQPLLTPVTNH